MQPGWYHDPSDPALLRWWDGTQWTSNAAPRSDRPSWGTSASVSADARRAQSSGGGAALALTMLSVATIAECFVMASFLHDIMHKLRHGLFHFNNGQPSSAATIHTPVGHILAIWGIGLVSFVSLILFISWLYKSAVVARRLNLPQRLSPGWAVGGFFVPIVNLWFPYWVAADLLPPGDPARRTVGWWWTCYLAQSVVVLPIFFVSIFSSAAAYVFCLIVAPIPVFAIINGRRMIAAVSARQATVG